MTSPHADRSGLCGPHKPYAGSMSESVSDARPEGSIFVIDEGSPVPPFRQLHAAVVSAVAEGRLLPGARLPTVRALASQLGLAVNTIAAAYRALESDGVIEGRGRAGTFVRFGEDPLEAQARRIAADAAVAFRSIGISGERARRLLDDAYAAG